MSAHHAGIQCIAGLGNPGPAYAGTRHNAGAWFIETLCQQYRLSFHTETRFNACLSQWSYAGKDYKLFIPNTYMNHSGQSVGSFAKYYRIPAHNILIAHDELDLAPGDYRFKTGGGHAGHNGLRDIMHHLQSRDFHRIRLGIGHPGHKDEVSDYVLSKPPRLEEQQIRKAIFDAIRALPEFIEKIEKSSQSTELK